MVEKTKRKGKRGQVTNMLTGTGLGVISFIMVIVIAAILLGKLDDINTSSLGNNSNATATIYKGFDLVFTTQDIGLLVVVVALLALALYSFMAGFGGAAGGRGRGR